MKLKAKGNNDHIIEKFSAQSSKSAKYAKTTVKKRDNSEIKTEIKKADGAGTNAEGNQANASAVNNNNT